MKIPTLLLSVSLLVNGVLAAAYLTGRANRASMGSDRTEVAGVQPVSRPETAGQADAPVDGSRLGAGQLDSLGALLRSGDGRDLARVLRAAGLSEDMVRAFVREQIAARYRARMRAIEEAARGDRPWWQTTGRADLTPEQRAQIRRLQREMRSEQERVLGPDDGPGGRGGAYAFLATDKAEAARQIEADYAEMERDLRDKMSEFRLPSDRDAFRLLDEEKHADLAALLSPGELEDLDMRTSPLSARLRREFGTAVQSQAEFQQIYQLAAAMEASYPRDNVASERARQERSAAEAALRQQIMDILGPERAAQVALLRDPDYRTMQAAASRLNLPASSVDAVLAVRAQASEQSQRILVDASLNADSRRAAMNEIATNVRAQLRNTMGSEGAEAFAQRAEWLRWLDRGAAFGLRPEGGVIIQRRDDG